VEVDQRLGDDAAHAGSASRAHPSPKNMSVVVGPGAQLLDHTASSVPSRTVLWFM
jgi:hypothetical protein